jgi:hypothetical protein
MGDAEFSSGDNIQAQSLLLEYKSQSLIQDSFGGINDQCIGVTSTELLFEFTAFMAEGGFIEKIERRAEFTNQVHNIAVADAQMTLLICLGGEGKES